MAKRMERFSQRARRVLTLAQEEAAQLRHSTIRPAHLVLGLVREEAGVAGRVLHELGLESHRARETVERLLGPGGLAQSGEMSLAPETKRALELAVQEARRMGHAHVGTEHLLLGVIQLDDGDLLAQFGVSPKLVRQRLQQLPQKGASSLKPIRLRWRWPTPRPPSALLDFKTRIQRKLQSQLDPARLMSQSGEARKVIEDLFEAILIEEGIVLSSTEHKRLLEQILADLSGLGPLEPLLRDESITAIMVNGPKHIFIERKGKLARAPMTFESREHMLRVVDHLLAPVGLKMDESQPVVEAHLPDGSRLHVFAAPVALNGPALYIRKVAEKSLTVEQLIQSGSVTPDVIEFLRAAVIARCNLLVSGDDASGKTTHLNALCGCIPADERIITVEDVAELRLPQEHVVSLVSRLPNRQGRGEVSLRRLVRNALRIRPDRVVVGEVQGGEALDLLRTMHTGREGVMFSVNAASPADALAHLEHMALSARPHSPRLPLRQQIASSVHLIVHLEQLRDGSRKVVTVAEVARMEGDAVRLANIFTFETSGFEIGKVVGHHTATGHIPKVLARIRAAGIHLPDGLFTPRHD